MTRELKIRPAKCSWFWLLLLVALPQTGFVFGSSVEMGDDDYNSPSIQEKILRELERDCKNGSRTHTGWCPTTWDKIFCWPSTAPGDTAVVPCPHYIAGFDSQDNASRHCLPSGDWYWNSKLNSTWTNYTRCFRDQMVTILMEIPREQNDNSSNIEEYVPTIKYISKVGYGVSLLSLIVAFLILANIKKLRCQRNKLHMHLFVSFMVRAFTFLLKDVLFVAGVGLPGSVLTKNGTNYWQGDDTHVSNWHCKAFTSLWQYSLVANYSWILMEGLYLHNLIFCALFAESNAGIVVYVVLGWGLPAIFVTTWVVLRVMYEDTYCWTLNKNQFIFQFIRLPTTISVIINFILFVNIVRVLLSKLRSTVTEETMRYKRLAKSTLILVPLFGVHYFLFLGVSYTVELVWLFLDQSFASFQGFFVAVLYCFLNGEVRTELKRVIRSRKLPRLARGFAFRLDSTRPHSGSTCSCHASGCKHPHHQQHPPPKGYESLEKLCGCCCWPCCRKLLAHHRSNHSMASTQVDIGINTRGGSLASSRGYLEVIGSPGSSVPNPLQMSAVSIAACQATGPAGCVAVADRASIGDKLCKNLEQSLLSFYSNMSEVDGRPSSVQAVSSSGEKCVGVEHEEVYSSGVVAAGDEHAWSDSECCHLAYELHHLHPEPDES